MKMNMKKKLMEKKQQQLFTFILKWISIVEKKSPCINVQRKRRANRLQEEEEKNGCGLNLSIHNELATFARHSTGEQKKIKRSETNRENYEDRY